MRIKVFSAPHLHEALAKVRQNMGPEALILDRQQTTDAAGGTLWHVHAALDNVPPPAKERVELKKTPTESTPQLNHADATIKRLERLVEGLSNKEAATLRTTLPTAKDQESFDQLTRLGVSASHAFDMANDFSHHNAISFKALRWGKRINPEEQNSSILFTGPTGSGKTTLIAKLAAHYSLKGVRVALVSTDTERMGGLEMLKSYANTLGIPFFAVRKAADIEKVLQKSQSAQLLLIDTEGWSPRRDVCLKRQAPLWEALNCTRRIMVIPANMDEEDGMQQLTHHGRTALTDIAFTKLDETRTPGKVVNWSVAGDLPMSYCSFGPEVPEQMGWLTAQALTTLLGKNERGMAA